MPYNRNQNVIFNLEVLTDPLGLGFAPMLAAFPAYTEGLSIAEYDALANQGMRDAYDAGQLAWQTAADTQWPLFEAAFETSRPLGDVESLSAGEIFDAIDMAQFTALDADKKTRVQVILGLGSDVKIGPSSKARAWLIDAFPTGASNTNLIALVTGRTQTRAQEIGLTPVYRGALERIVREQQ